MKTLPLLVALLTLSFASQAQAEVFACLAPGGAVLCHVTGAAGQAASLCNTQCPACKNVCTAQKLVSEGGGTRVRIVPNPEADTSPNTVRPGPDNQETARQIIRDGLLETPK